MSIMTERASKVINDVSENSGGLTLLVDCKNCNHVYIFTKNNVETTKQSTCCNEREIVHKYLKEGLLAMKKIALQNQKYRPKR